MSNTGLTACPRKKMTKGELNLKRKEGQIPAVLYGGKDNFSLFVNKDELNNTLILQSRGDRIFNLKFSSDSGNSYEKQVIIKDLQYHPLTYKLFHADLVEIDMNKKLVVEVPIDVTGEAQAVKKGGILNHQLRKITIECLPADIPKRINVDVSNLELGHPVHVKDILVDEKVKILENAEETILTLAEPQAEEEKPTEEEVVEQTEDSKKADE